MPGFQRLLEKADVACEGESPGLKKVLKKRLTKQKRTSAAKAALRTMHLRHG
jgi:hypothetical protein